MWMIRYLLCRMHDHAYVSVTCQGTDSHRHYLYCLSCGKAEGLPAAPVGALQTTLTTSSQGGPNC